MANALAAKLEMEAAETKITRLIRMHRLEKPNAKVSDGSQPPMAFDLSLSESAGSRSLDRLVELSRFAAGELGWFGGGFGGGGKGGRLE